MKVLLIQPRLEDFYTTPIRLYPLGLLYAAKVFEDLGWEVDILDCLSPLKKKRIPIPKNFEYLIPFMKNPYFFKNYYRFGISDEKIVSKIKASSPDLIGISSQFTAYYQSVEELARLIKKNFRLPVFIGGNHATAFLQEIKLRTPEIDHVLAGPAEDSIPKFLRELGFNFAEEPVDWKRMMPGHHLLPGDVYRIGKKNCVSMIASRGCPYSCEFCSVRLMFGREINYRPAEQVIQEMRWNYGQKNARIFNFEDDNLSFDRQWFLQFLKEVSRDSVLKDIELTAMNGVCYPTLDDEILTEMRRAGFKQLNLSFVTQSLKLKRKYHRPHALRGFESLIRTAQKLGFFITVYVIIGLPGQSFEEIKTTVDYLLELGVLVGPSVFYFPPGSRLYERLELAPKIKNNWNLYRSSAFALETEHLSRAQLIDLFTYTRMKNLKNRMSK
jgi:anaerobic magnesium-protoporphyrin IX monomethyl ester cyclase